MGQGRTRFRVSIGKFIQSFARDNVHPGRDLFYIESEQLEIPRMHCHERRHTIHEITLKWERNHTKEEIMRIGRSNTFVWFRLLFRVVSWIVGLYVRALLNLQVSA